MNIFPNWKVILEIAILWYVIYMILLFVKGTRTVQVLKGLTILIFIFVLSQVLGFRAISWVLTRIFALSVIALLVIFQPELRRGLARLGQLGVSQENIEMLEEIAKAAILLSKKKIGGLIAIEREIGLKNYIETGTAVDSEVSKEVIAAIFTPDSPLHDGGMVIQEGRVVAAGCLFPLAQTSHVPRSLGTRHRAAVGLSEETDAVVVVVSEETGGISISLGGKLTRDLSEENLAKVLKGMFYKPKKTKGLLVKFLTKMSPKITEKAKIDMFTKKV